MPLAIFGIENTALSRVATFAILSLAAVWVALVVFTFIDARRRISDPFLIGCATAASLFPFVGTVVYTIVRPAEFLEDVRERDIEMKSSETELRHLEAGSCHKCGFPTEPDFVRCPGCRTRLKEPCPSCARPVGLRWKVCPYCEHTLIASKRSRRDRPPTGADNGGDEPAAKAAEPRKGSGAKAKPRSGGSSSSAKSSSAAKAPASPEQPRRSRRVTRQDTSANDSPSSGSPRPGRSAGSAPTREKSTAGDSSSGAKRRRITVSEDDTEIAHSPINGGDGSARGSKPEPS